METTKKYFFAVCVLLSVHWNFASTSILRADVNPTKCVVKVNGQPTLKAVGDRWITNDTCIWHECIVDESGNPYENLVKENCPTQCKEGFTLREQRGKCCSKCVQNKCKYGDKMYNIGDSWRAEDTCTLFECSELNGMGIISTYKKLCPKVSNCLEEDLYVEDCCTKCRSRLTKEDEDSDLIKENSYKYHPCKRECVFGDAPKICRYTFVVEWYETLSKACYDCPYNMSDCNRPHCIVGDGARRSVLVVNRMMPGPAIEVCLNDTVVVDVKNHLLGESTTIHWHGLHQRETPYMDGVPHISQCPIQPHTIFRYNFKADHAGTHFWHSHTGMQRGDGSFGALIIREPLDKQSKLYDFDLSEHIIMIQDWAHQPGLSMFSSHHHSIGDNKPPNVLINGKGRYFPGIEENLIESPTELQSTAVRQSEEYTVVKEAQLTRTEANIQENQPHIVDVQPDNKANEPRIMEVESSIPGNQPHIIELRTHSPENQPRIVEVKPHIPAAQPHILEVRQHDPQNPPHLVQIKSHTQEDRTLIPEVTQLNVQDQVNFKENQMKDEDQANLEEVREVQQNSSYAQLNLKDAIPNTKDESDLEKSQLEILEDQLKVSKIEPNFPEIVLPTQNPKSIESVQQIHNTHTMKVSSENSKEKRSITNEELFPLETFRVIKGYKYRFRVINAEFLNCPISISVDDHTLTVINSDGYDFKPVQVSSLVTYAGERFDFVLEANQEVKNYWIRFKGLMDCDERFTSAHQAAVLHYEGAPHSEPKGTPIYEYERSGVQLNPLNKGPGFSDSITITELNSSDPDVAWMHKDPDFKFYIYYDFYAKDNPHFHVPNLYGFHQTNNKANKLYTPQLNHISLKFPAIPLMPGRDHINDDMFCNESSLAAQGKDCRNEFCECSHVLQVPLNSVVEMILIDEGVTFDANHPFHLHGNAFRVLAVDRIAKNVTVEQVKEMDKNGLLKRKFKNAPIKDTITIPDGGYTIIRFKADNPGYWLFHCHIEFHAEIGMALVLKVGDHNQMLPVPENFPTCSDYVPEIRISDGSGAAVRISLNFVTLIMLILGLMLF